MAWRGNGAAWREHNAGWKKNRGSLRSQLD